MEKDYLLRVEKIKKYYRVKKSLFSNKNVYAKSVDDVSFNIEKGKVVGLVGESGCGKSTIAKCILNLIEPTEGKVTFEDKVIYDVKNNIKIDKKELNALRKDMQIIFQDPYSSLDPKMKVGDIIAEGIRAHNIKSKHEALELGENMLQLCGLDKKYIERYPHEFSGGQRQRIGIARALALNPKFVICDEPTAALDVSIQSQILNLMLDLKEELNLTYLFISHNLNIVKFFCDEVLVMYLGVIVEKGSSKDVYDNSLHPYTRGLISSIPRSHPSIIKEKIIIDGVVKSNTEEFSGCRFSSRCPYASEMCLMSEPKLREIEKNHFVACHMI